MLDPERCLAPTFFIDHADPAVRDLARAWTAGASNDEERARRLFSGTRDGFRYDPYAIGLAPADYRASRILRRDRLFCVPKAILFVALVRACGIPAALGFADVRNHLSTPKLRARLRSELFVFHGYGALWLGGRWVKATPTFNRELCDRFGVPPLEFDGRSHALFHAFDPAGRRHMEYVEERGLHEDFPFDAMIGAWVAAYPHLFEPGGPLRPAQGGPSPS
jgi:transglutaminase-like putative cysteine protease